MTITNPSRQYVANPGAYAFGLADRLRKTLTVNEVSVEQAAGVFGVTRHTIGNWINGRVRPDKRTLMLWAMSFGVPLEWLETGEWPEAETEAWIDALRSGALHGTKKAPSEDEANSDESVRPKGFEPPTFWLGVDATRERGTSSVAVLPNQFAAVSVVVLAALLGAVRA